MANDTEHTTQAAAILTALDDTRLRQDLAAARLGYRDAEHFLTFAEKRSGSSAVADRWLHSDYQTIFNGSPDTDTAFRMLRQLLHHLHVTDHLLLQVGEAWREMTTDERLAIGRDYPRLMDPILAAAARYPEAKARDW